LLSKSKDFDQLIAALQQSCPWCCSPAGIWCDRGIPAGLRSFRRWSMIRKTGIRFSEKTMLEQKE
jgi:hypothetical protein